MSFLKDMGIEVKYKRLLRICNKYGFLSNIKKLCTNITYIKVKGGWLFLSVIIDLYNREIVSYAVSKTIDTAIAIETARKLKVKYPELSGCLLHSDQGCTYTSKAFHNFGKRK